MHAYPFSPLISDGLVENTPFLNTSSDVRRLTPLRQVKVMQTYQDVNRAAVSSWHSPNGGAPSYTRREIGRVLTRNTREKISSDHAPPSSSVNAPGAPATPVTER